ncbi:Protein CEPU-1 [Stylophora pistillata]|uniref:Protein CEPU-1 n=1 Tax=Stylophora pistillata TaxID=50429 RepID=A0A2B4RL58_STYPI|nr:Protein CEPU-1 [Stylophora pistillata]
MEYPMEYLDGLPLKVMYWSDRILYKDGGESVTWYEPAPGKTTSNSSEVLPPGIVQVNEGEPATLKWNYGLTFNIELTVVRFNKAGIFTADVSPQLKERFRGRFMPGSVSLDIFNVTMADDKEKGKFSLELIDPDGNGWKREIEVEVIVPTKVTGIRGDLSVLEGANLLLTCEASGRPKPNITWTNKRNSGVVQEGKLLNVTNINRNDSGTFTCTADNGFGEPQSQTVYVNVICAEEDTAIISSVDPVKHPQGLKLWTISLIVVLVLLFLVLVVGNMCCWCFSKTICVASVIRFIRKCVCRETQEFKRNSSTQFVRL